MGGALHVAVWVLVLSYFAVAVVMFVGWLSVEWLPRVETALETRWGWWLPGGVFWKLGRRGDTVGDKWPLLFGPLAYGLYRAGWQYTLAQRELAETPPRS